MVICSCFLDPKVIDLRRLDEKLKVQRKSLKNPGRQPEDIAEEFEFLRGGL